MREVSNSTGFRGTVDGLDLTDLLQLLHFGRKSTIVHVDLEEAIHEGQRSAEIFMHSGEIVHVAAGLLHDRVALRALLASQSGKISTSPLEGGCERTLEVPFEALLLDIMRELDEDEKATSPTPSQAAPPAAGPAAAAAPAGVGASPRKKKASRAVPTVVEKRGGGRDSESILPIIEGISESSGPQTGPPDVRLSTAPLGDVRPKEGTDPLAAAHNQLHGRPMPDLDWPRLSVPAAKPSEKGATARHTPSPAPASGSWRFTTTLPGVGPAGHALPHVGSFSTHYTDEGARQAGLKAFALGAALAVVVFVVAFGAVYWAVGTNRTASVLSLKTLEENSHANGSAAGAREATGAPLPTAVGAPDRSSGGAAPVPKADGVGSHGPGTQASVTVTTRPPDLELIDARTGRSLGRSPLRMVRDAGASSRGKALRVRAKLGWQRSAAYTVGPGQKAELDLESWVRRARRREAAAKRRRLRAGGAERRTRGAEASAAVKPLPEREAVEDHVPALSTLEDSAPALSTLADDDLTTRTPR